MREEEKNKGICNNIQKNNPQVLPPAGKNFYDFSKQKFIDAQKLGSMGIDSPSADYYNNSKFIQYKMTQGKKKTGKRMFIKNASFNQNSASPVLFESPGGGIGKNEGFSRIEGIYGMHKDRTMQVRRGMNRKPPRNPMSGAGNRGEIPKLSSNSNNEKNSIERSRNEDKRSSSMSKLGGQNYHNMIMNTVPTQEDLEIQNYQQYEDNHAQMIQNTGNPYPNRELPSNAQNTHNLLENSKPLTMTPQRQRREPLDLQAPTQNRKNNNSLERAVQNTVKPTSKVKVPVLDFQGRSHSQGEMGRLYSRSNPISQLDAPLHNPRRSGNLWHHQAEARELERRRQQMFIQGLNEQRKQEKQRKLIDQKYESLVNHKIEIDKNSRVEKEDRDREAYRRIFEEASHQNDLRVNHYLNNYYLPPKEKETRNNVASTKASSGSGKRRIRIMKKKYRTPKISDRALKEHLNPPEQIGQMHDPYQGHYQY